MSRHRNLIFFAAIVLVELLVLGYQVHRNRDIRFLRHGSILLVAPAEKAVRVVTGGAWNLWRNYVDLRGARRENRNLIRELNDLRSENDRLREQAEQHKRLQVLFQFKELVPSQTIGAQVISSGASDNSRLLLLDRGSEAGLRPDMAVIVPDGVVGKVLRVFPRASQALLLTDSSSGVACLLENSRIHGILKGQNKPLAMLAYISNDDKVQIGERVVTSGEDRIFPKGLSVGVVVQARPGASFQEVLVQPSAKLGRLEEVLVVTKKVEAEMADVPESPFPRPVLPDSASGSSGQAAPVTRRNPTVTPPGPRDNQSATDQQPPTPPAPPTGVQKPANSGLQRSPSAVPPPPAAEAVPPPPTPAPAVN